MKIKIKLDTTNKIIEFLNNKISICKIDINSSSPIEIEKLNDWMLKKINEIDDLKFEFESEYNKETTLYKVAKVISDELKKEIVEIQKKLIIKE